MKPNHKTVAALVGAILLVALGVVVSFSAFRRMEDAAAARKVSFIVAYMASELLADLTDAETGQRGFALTGDEAFLKPYLAVRDHFGTELAELRTFTLSPAARLHLDALPPLIEAKLAEMARVIQLRRDGDLTAASAVVARGDGRRLMDSIRREIGGFIRIEKATLIERDNRFQSDLRRLFALIVIASVIALLLAAAFVYLIYRETQHRLQKFAHGETQRLLALEQAANQRIQQVNDTLRTSEEKLTILLRENGDLKSALDEHAIVAFTDPQGKITYVNDKFCAISRYSREELLGRDHRLINSGHHPKEFIRELWTTITGGRVWHGEIKNRAKDGSFYWVDTTIVPFLDEHGRPRQYVAIRADITARKLTELAAAQLGAIVASSEDGIIGKTLEGVVTSWNAGAEKIFGFSADEMRGQRVARLIPADRQPEEVEILAKIGRGETVRHFDTVRMHKDGHPLDVSVTVSPIRDVTGRIVGASKVVRDITERKQGEEHVRRLNAELEQRVVERTAELEAANQELEAFSYSVSHDLRSPVRAIDGFSQAVLEDFGPQLPAEGRRDLQIIRESAQRMGALIDDLLAFARLSRQELNKRPIDTGKFVHASLEELGSPWPDRQVVLRLGELPPSSGDPALVKQVWLNLLSNALKYTRKRAKTEIEIGCARIAGVDTFFVRDNGTGFDMQYADKLFGVFQRFHRLEEFEGTGVGLAIVQRIVHRHGGRVWADAAVDRGATFYFTLEKEKTS